MKRPDAILRSGARVDLLAPQLDRLRVSDLGEGLAKLNRWAGANVAPFSVAQHSLLVAAEMFDHDGATAALYGMLHDAHEPMTGEITLPTEFALEQLLPGTAGAIATLKSGLDRAIHMRFDLDWPMPPGIAACFLVSHAAVTATELRDLLIDCDDAVSTSIARGSRPLPRTIVPFTSWTRADSEWRIMLGRYAARAGLRLRLD